MKMIWKRAAALALSGVLLLSSLPMGALATEDTVEPTETQAAAAPAAETQPTETQPAPTETQPAPTETQPAPTETQPAPTETQPAPTETQPTPTETQPVVTPVAPVTNTVANSENETPLSQETYIKVNGRDPASDAVTGVSLKDGTEAGTKILMLDNAKIQTIEAKGYSLTIELKGENEINAGEAVAISVDKDLTITGDGSLKVTTKNATAVSVAGSGEGGNKKGLTIDGAVVSVETTFTETDTEKSIGISSPNGVLITGAVHFKATHTKSGEAYTMDKDGYVNGSAYTKETPTQGGSALEFVAGEHVGEWQSVDNKHYKACKDSSCLLIAGTKLGQHDIEDQTKYKIIDNTQHQKIYACCDMARPGTQPENHTLSYNANGATITAKCDCGAEDSLTLIAEDCEWDGNSHGASFAEPTGVLAGKAAQSDIRYAKGDESIDAVPSEIGDYTASITLDNATAEVKYSITQIDFSKAVVTVAEGSYTYNAAEHKPEVTVKLNEKDVDITGASISYSDNINAGEATVTVTMPENSNYVNSATGRFKIAPITITQSDIELGDVLTYNGEEQTQTVVKANEDSDVTFDVTGNKQTDAGTYTLKVTGNGNYSGSVNMEYTIAQAEVSFVVKDNQIIAGGVKGGAFAEPKCLLGDAELPGAFKYKVYADNVVYAESADYIDARSALQRVANDGSEVKIDFKFTPTDTKNYKNENDFSGSFTVKLQKVEFKLNPNEIITDKALYGSELVYGVEDPVDTSVIKAYVNGTLQEPEKGYTVTYTSVDGKELKNPLDAGQYTFVITYTGMVGDDTYCEDYLVYSSTQALTIKKRKVDVKVEPVPNLIYEEGKTQDLVTGTTDVGTLKYSFANNDDPANWLAKAQKTDPAAYWVYYKVVFADGVNSENYESENLTGKVRGYILPKLEATYGETLADVRLPEGFSLHDAGDAQNEVGNAGAHKIKLDYTHPDDADKTAVDDYEHASLTGFETPLTVNPKKITPTLTVKDNDKYISYNKATVSSDVAVMDGDEKLAYKTDYTLTPVKNYPDMTITYTVKAVEKGNYEFDDVQAVAKLYYAEHASLKDENFPEADLSGTSNGTLSKVKSALSEKLEEDTYPESSMKYFTVYMQRMENKQWVEYRDADAFPTDGIEYVIPYADIGAGLDRNDSFKVSIMDTLGANAGKEAKEITYTKTDDGLKISLSNYAAVCVAVEIDLDEEHSIKKSILYNGSSSNKGTLTFKVDDDTVTKAKYGDVVYVTAKPNTGYSISSVSCAASNGASTGFTKVSEGNYKFTMPASDVTVTMKLSKTSSSSKNPNSGDSSNIYLWLTFLAASAVALVALVIVMIRKRRK